MARSNGRLLAFIGLVLGAVLVLAILLGGGDASGREFSARFDAAESVLTGTAINAGGKNIGSVEDVEPVDGGRAARVTMQIKDDAYWPLPRDTKLELRFGGTVSFSNRYILLSRGKDRAHPIEDGGSLLPDAVKTPVEVDLLFNEFTTPTRMAFRRMLANTAPVFQRGGKALGEALERDKLPLVATGAGKLAQDLTKNEGDLRALLRTTSNVLRAADTANPDLRTLLTGFGQTADAIAAENANLKRTISNGAPALRSIRSTARLLLPLLDDAQALVDDLGPGVRELRGTIPELRPFLAKLSEVAPVGANALRLATESAPAVPFLTRAWKASPELISIGRQLTKELGCLRPYTPEIAHMGTSWGDFTNPATKRDRLVRANLQSFLPAATNSMPYTAGDAAKLYPNLEYGFPRPPGGLVNQPWFQPQCGITKDVLDPSKDPESADFVKNRSGRGAGK